MIQSWQKLSASVSLPVPQVDCIVLPLVELLNMVADITVVRTEDFISHIGKETLGSIAQ